MAIQPRPELHRFAEAAHGGVDELELESLGLQRADVVDFSSNINPFAVSEHVREALASVRVDEYPDRESMALCRVLSTQLQVPLEQLLVGNGSSELLWLIAFCYLRPCDTALIVGPTYSEYARSSQLMGTTTVGYNASPERNFEIPIRAVADALCDRPRACYLCNPNNPTGQLLDAGIVERWAQRFEQTLFVIDEAYIDFVPHAKSLVTSRCANVIVLRSLTKAFGLAGLRLGYLVAAPEIVTTLRSVRVPWSVNAAAQQAGIAAIQDQHHQRTAIAQLLAARQSLAEELQRREMHPIPSSTGFFLLPVKNARVTRAKLLRSKILVRDCSSFGLPQFIRISARGRADNQRLLEALISPEAT